MKNTKKKGFTLVELLVVIAIIAILAGASIVGYLGFTTKAKQSNAINELAQYKTVAIAKLADGVEEFEGNVKFTYDGTTLKVTDTDTEGYALADLVKKLFGENDITIAVDPVTATGKEATITSIEYTKDGKTAVWTIETGEVKAK